MKVTYDAHADVLLVVLRTDVTVADSDESSPGVILDYDRDGNLVSVEVLDASKRVTDATKVDFTLADA
jgi:uncharacterized protein YuzE